ASLAVKMDNVSQRISDIHELLLEEEEELSDFRENLDKSDQLTQNMVGILTSFENRLKQLEETILPVHKETVNLQKLQQNIESALTSFDNVLKHHEAVKELESVIKHGPREDLEQYLKNMDLIIDAKVFFNENNPSSPEVIKATNLFENCVSISSCSFNQIFPVKLLQILDSSDDVAEETEPVSLEPLPEERKVHQNRPVFEPGHRKQNSLVSEVKEDQVDPETVSFLCCTTGLLKLMQSEVQLLHVILIKDFQNKALSKIIETPLETVLRMGDRKEVLATRLHCVHGILPILRYLLAVEKDFDETLQGTTEQVRGKFPQLISALETNGAKALEEFFDFVKNDPDKANMPKDGTVHELTSNSIIYLESINEYVDTVAAMLLQSVETSYQSRKDKNVLKKRVAVYLSEVLGALGLNLVQKAKTYSDQYLGDVFLLNNYHYILKSLQSWNKVLNHILEGFHPNAARPDLPDASKMKDKERHQIKEKFKGFNQDFEELYKTQKCYAIADRQLREFIRRDNKEFIIPQYTKFWNRYIQIDFSKNKDKYIKYLPSDIEKMMDKFFDVTA
ncbi:hypothetical protein BSL78_29403, partial [Apostichopus japonicus]